MSDSIANKNLRAEDVPQYSHGGWQGFALTFDGYEFFGSLEMCADRARAVERRWDTSKELPQDLSTLRGCLFYWQRAERFMGEELPDHVERHVDAILAAIRRLLPPVRER